MKRRLISLALALVLLAGLFPAAAWAEELPEEEAPEVEITDDEASAGDALAADLARHEAEGEILPPEAPAEIEEEILLQTAAAGDGLAVFAAGSTVMSLDQYDAELAQIARRIGSSDAAVLAGNADYKNMLLRRRLVEKAGGYANLTAKMSADANFAACIEWLFSDTQMLNYYCYGGAPQATATNNQWHGQSLATPATYINSFSVLTKLYTAHKADMSDATNAPLYKRMWAAIALTHSVPIYAFLHYYLDGMQSNKWIHQSEPVGRYELFKKLYHFNFLADEFALYNVEELRMVVSAALDNTQLEWLHRFYRVKYLKNADYATNAVKATQSNIGGWCGLPYTTIDKTPAVKELFEPQYWDKWNTKYQLEIHDEYFDFKVDYGINEQGKWYVPQWMSIERGGVCFDTSFTATCVRNAFGLATKPMFQHPNHLSFMPYNIFPQENGPTKVGLGNGYNVYGIAQSGFSAYGTGHVITDWNLLPFANVRNLNYFMLGSDLISGRYEGHDWEKSELIKYLADITAAKQDWAGALALYEKTLATEPLHLGAFVGIADMYAKLGKGDSDYFALIQRAAETYKWYPRVMYDFIMGYLFPRVQDGILRADILAYVDEMINISIKDYQSSPLWQPGWSATIAYLLKAELPKVATISFDTGRISINSAFKNFDKDFLYSFDGGETWNRHPHPAGEESFALTPAELAQITDAKDIKYQFDTAKYVHTIPIGTGATPQITQSKNFPNDDEDRFIYLEGGLEYSEDEGATWKNLTMTEYFTGARTLWVRRKWTGANLPSAHTVVTFKPAEDTPERRYLRLSGNVRLLTADSDKGFSTNGIGYAVDMNKSTYWISSYSSNGYKPIRGADGKVKEWVANHNYNIVFEIGEPHYISAIGYVPALRADGADDGTIAGCEVYISNDKKTWQLAGSTNSWAYVKSKDDQWPREQSIDFAQPAYTKYVKIVTTKVGLKNFQGFACGYATAAEFKLYENETCLNKKVDEVVLRIPPEKATYKVGDRLDLNDVNVQLIYTDGTTSLLPASELTFSEDVFASTAVSSVTGDYKGVKAGFTVWVEPNDRTATAISSVLLPPRKFYAGDRLEKSDILVQVTNGTEQWYLLPEQFTLENNTLSAGASQVTVKHNNLSHSFTVNTENAIRELRIDTAAEFKSQYFIGDVLDLVGLSVKLVSENGGEKTLTAAEYTLELLDESRKTVTAKDFARLGGTRFVKAVLKDKPGVYAELPITVFTYFSVGEFSFEALAGDTACELTGYTPGGDLNGKTVEIPETVRIGEYEYRVEKIGSGAFAGAADMTAVKLPKSIVKIETGAFSACTKLEKIYMTEHKSLGGFVCADEAFGTVPNAYVYLNSTLSDSPSPIPGYRVAGIAQVATDIAITAPAKTQYILGDSLNTEGLAVSARLPDGSSVTTSSYTLSGFDPSAAGEQTVTVTLEGSRLSRTFTVTVAFPRITVTKQPAGAVYLRSADIRALSVEAAAENNAAMWYQWYRSETPERSGTAIENATASQFTPTGVGYYYAGIYIKDKNNASGEMLYTDLARVMVGDYPITDGTAGYASLKEAAENAPENATLILRRNITVSEAADLTDKKFTLDGQGHTIGRGEDYTLSFLKLKGKSVVTLKNVVFDGGAVWTGEIDPVVKHGLTNSGKQAITPFVLLYDGTELTLGEGAVLQNNFNNALGATCADDKDGTGSNITGGAVWGRSATVNLRGGIIRDNASAAFGSAMYVRGTSVFTSYGGEISGNLDPDPNSAFNASAICTDNDTTLNIQGGEFRNNKGGKQGGVFWIGHGTLIVSGGTFEENYCYGNGGVAFFYAGGNKATLTLTGGVFRNNTALGDGGALYLGKAAKLTKGTFENNTAGGNGGALWIQNGALALTNNRFVGNTATGNGGAVWVSNTISTNGDIYIDNAAECGQAIYVNGQQTLTITNASAFMQNVHMQSFRQIKLTGESPDKTVQVTTDDEVANGTVVASMELGKDSVKFSLNGYKAVWSESEKYSLRLVVTPRVTYHKNGGYIDLEGDYTSYTAGTAFTLPSAHRDGYTFGGWYADEALTGSAVTQIGADQTADQVFWAKWTVQSYPVTLNLGGGTAASPLASYTYGVGATLPSATRGGYVFGGWYDNSAFTGEPVTQIGAEAFGNRAFWAKWVLSEYTVSFHTNEGRLLGALAKYTYGVGAALPSAERAGHTFEGWYDNLKFIGSPIERISAEESGNKSYWAKWSINKYAVTLNPDGGSLADALTKYTYGTGAALPLPAKRRYTFAGWYTNENLTGAAVTEIGAQETGDKSYWAKWILNEYSVTLHTDGGSLANGLANYNYGVGAVLPEPTKTGFIFNGWYDNANFSGKAVTEIGKNETGDRAFYAKWTRIYDMEHTAGNVRVFSPKAESYVLIFAAYNSKLRMTDCRIVPVGFDAPGEQTVAVPKLKGETVKVMFLNGLSSLVPLTAPLNFGNQ